MKIADNIYLLESTKGAYVYIIKSSETVMIDTGFPWVGKKIIKELAEIGVNTTDIKHILLTHHDIDHIGNAAMLQQLTGATLWAPKEDIPYITGETDRYGFKKYLKYIFRIKKPGKIQPYTPGQIIEGIQVIPTHGHTPGHVCFLYNDTLFVGDLVENKDGQLLPYPPPWNWNDKLMLESYENMKKIPHKWVCPAHGQPIGQPIK